VICKTRALMARSFVICILFPSMVEAQNVTPPSPAPAQLPKATLGQTPATNAGQAPVQLPPTGPTQRLTVQEAEALALKNNPQISVFRLISLASGQVTREQ